MNIYLHKLFGKLKLISTPTGDNSAVLYSSPFKMRMLHCLLSHIPKCLDIKLSVFLLDEGQFCFIAMCFSSYYSTT